MKFSEQQVFCGACGKELKRVLTSGTAGSMVPRMAVCDDRCREEITWRYVSSTLGKSYEPWTRDPPSADT